MNYLLLIFVTVATLLIVFTGYYFVRIFFAINRKKAAAGEKGTTEVGFVVDTFHDLVTKLKEKERELKDLKEIAEERASAFETYNENILQSVPSGVVSFDQELNIAKMNAAAEKILEMTEAEARGRPYDAVFGSPIRELLGEQKTVERAEFGYSTRKGKRIWLGLNLSPLRDSAGGVIGRILVFTDLTELKAFQSQVELRERLSTLGEMSAGIAHELRNPMAVISGYTKILLRKADEQSLPAVEAIAREVGVMDRIIADFLSFARPKEPVLAEVDLEALMESCIGSVTQGRDRVNVRRSGRLPVVRADEVLMREVFTNLLQNAVEAMPEGGDLGVEAALGEDLRISVSDSGHGIQESIMDRVFLPFFTTKERGTGLGLSLVHRIIASHGWTIDLRSDEKGTKFTIRLPRGAAVEAVSARRTG